jgi:hypothetical protein
LGLNIVCKPTIMKEEFRFIPDHGKMSIPQENIEILKRNPFE